VIGNVEYSWRCSELLKMKLGDRRGIGRPEPKTIVDSVEHTREANFDPVNPAFGGGTG
jgi:hypothetical protein